MSKSTFTLVRENVVARPYEEYERDTNGLPVTADVVSVDRWVFQDVEDLTEFLAYKGVSRERAAVVIGRGCGFEIEPAEGMEYARYRVSYSR